MASARSYTARTFAIGNALIALLLSASAIGLDVKSRPLQAGAAVLVLLLLASSFGLLASTGWRLFALRACAWIGLAAGVAALSALAVSAGYLHDVDGHLHATGTLSTLLVLTLLLPYLLLYPSLQLLWAHRQQRSARGYARASRSVT